jgi:hypothetical protein
MEIRRCARLRLAAPRQALHLFDAEGEAIAVR